MSGKDAVTIPLMREIVSASIARARAQRLSVFDTAVMITLDLAAHFGNERVYIPSGAQDKARAEAAAREVEIFDKFDGRNSLALAKEYGVSQRHIQRVIARERARRRRGRDRDYLK